MSQFSQKTSSSKSNPVLSALQKKEKGGPSLTKEGSDIAGENIRRLNQ